MSHVSRYHPVLVALHWLLAVLLIAALALGALIMAKVPNSDPMKLEALRSHMAGGLIIVGLMLTRLLFRARTRHPATAPTGNPLLDRLAWVSHRMFYGVVMVMGLSGLTLASQADLFQIVFGGHGTLPPDLWVYSVRFVHYVASRVLMVLIALHVAGALYHTFILRDGLLRRMAFGRRALSTSAPATFNPTISKVQS
jgi:cytochrome b561